jgi:hypothetical protein
MATRFTNTMTGVEANLQVMKKYAKAADSSLNAALKVFADRIFDMSQVLVPVRVEAVTPPHDIPGGSLKASGAVSPDPSGPSGFGWRISYGETAAGHGSHRPATYAVYVHEIPYNHFFGQWKYLEHAVDLILPEMVAQLPKFFREAQLYAVGSGGAFTSGFGEE